jgi:hypothetical protein
MQQFAYRRKNLHISRHMLIQCDLYELLKVQHFSQRCVWIYMGLCGEGGGGILRDTQIQNEKIREKLVEFSTILGVQVYKTKPATS